MSTAIDLAVGLILVAALGVAVVFFGIEREPSLTEYFT